MTTYSRLRTTHTYVELEVPRAAYDFIRARLKEAGYHHVFDCQDDGSGPIDLTGIAVIPATTGAKMEAHQERVIAEKDELSEKLDKLETFVGGSIYAALPPAEQSRLTRQKLIMELYEQVLNERIAAF